MQYDEMLKSLRNKEGNNLQSQRYDMTEEEYINQSFKNTQNSKMND